MLTDLKHKVRSYTFWLSFFTFVVWSLMVAEFLSKGGVILPQELATIYIALLTAYVTKKEVTRWNLPTIERKHLHGEYWIYVWLSTALLICVLKGLFPDKFQVPGQLVTITGFTIVHFAGTLTSKKFYKKRGAKAP